MRTLVIFFLVAGFGCATNPKHGAVAEKSAGIAFIDDDYAGALAKAKAEGALLFVDTWAPWCHTCLSMKSFVFTDAKLAAAPGIVWLSVDTEKPRNANFLEKFPLDNWPTLWVIDPRSERPLLKWIGSATVEELEKLLGDARRAAAAEPSSSEAMAKLAEADRHHALGEPEGAAKLYALALHLGGENWSERSRAIVSMIMALDKVDKKACGEQTRLLAASLPKSQARVAALSFGLYCAMTDLGAKHETTKALDAMAEEAVGFAGALADDRSSLYELRVDLHQELGDTEGAKKIAQAWLSFLESEATRAESAEKRAAFDAHRVGAAIAAEAPARAIAPLELSEKEFPNDFNPPARLAIVYREMKNYPAALAASTRALPKANGPRRLRISETRADILEAMNDTKQARMALEEALESYTRLPVAQQSPKSVARVRSRIEKLR